MYKSYWLFIVLIALSGCGRPASPYAQCDRLEDSLQYNESIRDVITIQTSTPRVQQQQTRPNDGAYDFCYNNGRSDGVWTGCH
jgi:hypothetical protein